MVNNVKHKRALFVRPLHAALNSRCAAIKFRINNPYQQNDHGDPLQATIRHKYLLGLQPDASSPEACLAFSNRASSLPSINRTLFS